jgi:uncharacterized protein YcfJ
MKVFIIALFATLTATAAIAETRQATITSIQPNYETVYSNVPRTQCRDVEVPVFGQGNGVNTEGAIIGGLLGGVVGNQFGGGSGNDAMTGIGAITGAIIGGNSGNRVVTGYRVERQCTEVMVRQEQRQIRNYTITYQWNGVSGRSYTYNQYRVGDRIPVTVSINAQ